MRPAQVLFCAQPATRRFRWPKAIIANLGVAFPTSRVERNGRADRTNVREHSDLGAARVSDGGYLPRRGTQPAALQTLGGGSELGGQKIGAILPPATKTS